MSGTGTPALVLSNSLEDSKGWSYCSDSETDSVSTYSIASLTFKRDTRGIFLPDIETEKSKKDGEKGLKGMEKPLVLPDISRCVVMTTTRRRTKKEKGRFFPEISVERLKKEREDSSPSVESRCSKKSREKGSQKRNSSRDSSPSKGNQKKDRLFLPSI